MATRRLAAPVLATALTVAGAGVAVACQQGSAARTDQVAVAVPDLAMVVVGLLVLRSRPGHAVGRLLVAGPLTAVLGTAVLELAVRRLDTDPHDLLGRLGATLGSTGRGLGWMVLVLLLPLLFPEGRHDGPPRLTAWAGRVSAAALTLMLVVSLFSPNPTDLRVDDLDNPIGLPGSWRPLTDAAGALLLLVGALGILLGAATLVARFRAGSGVRRQQIAWLGLSFASPIAVLLLSIGDHAEPWMFGVATLPIPVAVVVSIRQQRLYDLSLAVNRSLTYGSLWLLIAVVYAVVVGGVGAMLRTEGASWLPWVAAGVVAVTFAPLRDALQHTANRITYGQWASPDEVLTRTSRRLADAGDVAELLRSLTSDLGEALALGHVEIVDDQGRALASFGEGGPLDGLALTAYGQQVGELRWTRRDLRDSDRVLLADLATQLGAVVHADRLLTSVRAAQERLVLAREEERRRLRRDLHDGLGPALAGLTLQVETVRNQLGAHEADTSLLVLRDGIQETVLDVRRIVEGLRPAALDDLGLLESVRLLADRVGLTVTVQGATCTELPAAVEVAAYRIVQEALTNVARHAGATSATVTLDAQDSTLVVAVADDGRGDVRPRPGGLGLGTMRERAEEIGGTLEISSAAGTTVVARLPLARKAAP